MRSGVLLTVLGASLTFAAVASAQDAPHPPTAPTPPTAPSGAPMPPPPPPQPQQAPPPPNDGWHQPPPGGWHQPNGNAQPGPPPAWEPQGPHHPPMPSHMTPPGSMQGRVQITVDSGSEKHAVLERRVKREEEEARLLIVVPRHAERETWEQVCVAPCTIDVDRASTYRISKENAVTSSGDFTLPPQVEDVKIDVQPGNWWAHNVGTKLIGAGTVAGITGAALISAAHTWDSHHTEIKVRTAGIITASIGAGLLAIGIPIAIVTRTKVSVNGAKIGKNGPKLTLDGLVF